MKLILKDGERLVLEEDMKPECRAELDGILEQIKETQKEAIVLNGRMEAVKAKGEYLNKMKWATFDKYHPNTNSEVHTSPDGYHAHRRYNLEHNVVALIECESGGGPGGILGEILEAVFASKKPNKPKDPAPAAAETAAAG